MGNLRLPRTNDFLIYLYFLWYLFDHLPKPTPLGREPNPQGTRRRVEQGRGRADIPPESCKQLGSQNRPLTPSDNIGNTLLELIVKPCPLVLLETII